MPIDVTQFVVYYGLMGFALMAGASFPAFILYCSVQAVKHSVEK